MTRFRSSLATLLWLAAGAAATVLAVAALLRALDVDLDEEPARTLLDAADALSLHALAQVSARPSAVDALLVWGAVALAWLVVGWLLDRMVRPGPPAPV